MLLPKELRIEWHWTFPGMNVQYEKKLTGRSLTQWQLKQLTITASQAARWYASLHASCKRVSTAQKEPDIQAKIRLRYRAPKIQGCSLIHALW